MFKSLIAALCMGVGLYAFAQESKESREVNCAPTKALVEALTLRYDERLVAWGEGPGVSDNVMSLWVNQTSGTWSILVSRQNGTSCVLGTGLGFTVQRSGGSKV